MKFALSFSGVNWLWMPLVTHIRYYCSFPLPSKLNCAIWTHKHRNISIEFEIVTWFSNFSIRKFTNWNDLFFYFFFLNFEQPSGWRKLRNIVQWTPFFQTYKKQRYPWVQLAGHQGNFKAGPDQGTVLKKLCPKEELCFNVSQTIGMRLPFELS